MMLTITNNQIKAFTELSINRFKTSLINSFRKKGEWLPKDEIIQKMIMEAIGAGIDDEENIYKYIGLAVKHEVLTSDNKPDIIKNILYANSDAESKLRVLKKILSKKNDL